MKRMCDVTDRLTTKTSGGFALLVHAAILRHSIGTIGSSIAAGKRYSGVLDGVLQGTRWGTPRYSMGYSRVLDGVLEGARWGTPRYSDGVLRGTPMGYSAVLMGSDEVLIGRRFATAGPPPVCVAGTVCDRLLFRRSQAGTGPRQDPKRILRVVGCCMLLSFPFLSRRSPLPSGEPFRC